MQDEKNLFNPLDLDVSRSTFHNKPTRSGTCMAGRLIPAWYKAIMPGTGINMKTDSLFKMSTPVYPTMDRLFADVYFFFTPNRLVMSRRYGTPDLNDSIYSWAYFIGAQDNLLNMPLPQNGAELPAVNSSGWNDGTNWHKYRPQSLADYLNLPGLASSNSKYSPFPLLSYMAIYNENFREPSTAIPVTWSISQGYFQFYHDSANLYVNKTEATIFGMTNTDNDDYLWKNPFVTAQQSDANLMLPLPVSVFHGYLGSMLPWPQRNSDGVALPLGDKAPLAFPGNRNLDVEVRNRTGSALPAGTSVSSFVSKELSNPGESSSVNGVFGGSASTLFVNVPNNAYADLSTATAANVNALRAAIQKQRWYEKLARSGNRYDELEYGTFGVRPKDSGSDRPVYLGGKRIELAIQVVASTNGGGSDSTAAGSGSLGTLGGFSHTNDKDSYMFSAEFDDWGTLMCVFCIRHSITLGTGTDRSNLKSVRDEFYFPTFAHLGEQSSWLGEVADVGGWNVTAAKQSIGFQQAWEEDRTDVDRVCGLLRPGESLGFMTYAESHTSGFSLAQFLNASRQIVHLDNTLAVSSIASGFQFIYQMTFDYVMRAPIPVYSIPGLMDHF